MDWNRTFFGVLLAAMFFIATGTRAHAASSSERRMFNAAAAALQDGFNERAEKEFGDFVAKHPESDLKTDAVFRQAQARFKLKNFSGSLNLLAAHVASSGAMEDQYRFWMAESQFEIGQFADAAANYAIVVDRFPKSRIRLAAVVDHASALFQLKDWSGITRRLGEEGGAFMTEAKAQPDREDVIRGYLLLGEAFLEQKQYESASGVLDTLSRISLTPRQSWQQIYLMARVLRASERVDDAAQAVVRLVAQSKITGDKMFQAQSLLLQAELLLQQGDPKQAMLALEGNLPEDMPADLRRQSLLRLVELSVGQGQLAQAADRLEDYLSKRPSESAAGMLRTTLGELRLKQYYSATNAVGTEEKSALLSKASVQFDRVLSDKNDLSWVGRAALGRAWANWEGGKTAEAQADFVLAAEKLPISTEQAVAFFKWADTQFLLGDFAGAEVNYRKVVSNYSTLPEITNGLVSQALHQLVRTAIRRDDAVAAQTALKKILESYPDTFFATQDLLLAGQAINKSGDPLVAREMFDQFLARFPQSELAAEVRLARARTFIQERKWTQAIQIYQQWVGTYASHPGFARAEFDLGWLHYKAGQETNALTVFTNFVAQFPTNELAARAQSWVGDFHFRAGEFVEAEKSYQQIFQNTNWPVTRLTYQARLDAGRAAFARAGFSDARGYFTNLANNPQAPQDLINEALYAYGDTFIEEPVNDPIKALEKYADAINAFSLVVQNSKTNLLAALANGRIGDCHLQLASKDQDPERYKSAAEFYQKVIESPYADISARSQAQFKLACVHESQARNQKVPAEQAILLNFAVNQLVDVVHGSKLRDGEMSDPYWVQKAGFSAGRLLEEQQRWAEAASIYGRLSEWFPALRETLDKRVKLLKEQSGI